ncbi:DUF397 domain-containing protein [Micromonospora sp. NBC_01796]|uniref:DUF397 domain-containing protein n=1 Tax=Micromonospora sp. NBC_01796 TaxID=2975987 RepID=UPI002DDC64DE|nr:DUF397 domain-containing protein [Micromonospora sp. NBC_01796]WSA88759.1 DUF397 domain-containing protein [Micromonospora sp. NBC_01796]
MPAATSTTARALPEVAWHISTRSGNGSGNCVEAGLILDGSRRVAVRHSHHPDGDVLVYGSAEWTSFLNGVKTDGFNPL